jgi:hypothetical protein
MSAREFTADSRAVNKSSNLVRPREVITAQYIPTWFAVAVLSPLAVILLAIILGILGRS